jgi:hypothetical protein
MAATVGISRVYLNEDGQGVITCGHCDVQRQFSTSQASTRVDTQEACKRPNVRVVRAFFMCDSIAEDTQEFLCIFQANLCNSIHKKS